MFVTQLNSDLGNRATVAQIAGTFYDFEVPLSGAAVSAELIELVGSFGFYCIGHAISVTVKSVTIINIGEAMKTNYTVGKQTNNFIQINYTGKTNCILGDGYIGNASIRVEFIS